MFHCAKIAYWDMKHLVLKKSRETIGYLLKFHKRAAQNRAFPREFVTLMLAQFVLKIAHLAISMKPHGYRALHVMCQSSAPFAVQNITEAVFRAVWYFLQPLNIVYSEIWKKSHEEDLKQTRRDRPVRKKKLRNYNKCEFSNFFLFQRPKMIISVLVTWMIVDCNLAVKVVLCF